jgi:hypothetical protein
MADSPPDSPAGPPPSKLTQEHRDRIQRWSDEKIKDTKSCGCPLCGSKNWTLLEDFVAPANFSRNGGLLLGGKVYPHFMLICDVCGNVQFINAIRAGVLDKDPEK